MSAASPPVTTSDLRQQPAAGGRQGEGVSEQKGATVPAASAPARGLLVRPARTGDRAALEAMFLRCTPATVYQRFHGPVKSFPASYLTEALAGVPAHYALVAVSEGCVVALASCRFTDDGTSAELGILIEDGWQRHGLGRRLLGQLVAHAASAGVTALDAQVLTEQDWLIGLLSEHGTCTARFRTGVLEVRLRLHSDGT